MLRNTLALHFGALCDPIRKQLHDLGLKMDIEKLEHRQKDADAIVRLHMRGLAPESVLKKARQKLVNMISEEVEPL
jgi:hypothetical protein